MSPGHPADEWSMRPHEGPVAVTDARIQTAARATTTAGQSPDALARAAHEALRAGDTGPRDALLRAAVRDMPATPRRRALMSADTRTKTLREALRLLRVTPGDALAVLRDGAAVRWALGLTRLPRGMGALAREMGQADMLAERERAARAGAARAVPLAQALAAGVEEVDDSAQQGARTRRVDLGALLAAARAQAVTRARPVLLSEDGGSVPNAWRQASTTVAAVLALPDGRAWLWAERTSAPKRAYGAPAGDDWAVRRAVATALAEIDADWAAELLAEEAVARG